MRNALPYRARSTRRTSERSGWGRKRRRRRRSGDPRPTRSCRHAQSPGVCAATEAVLTRPLPCRGPPARCAASSSPARRSWKSTSWGSGTRCACAASCLPPAVAVGERDNCRRAHAPLPLGLGGACERSSLVLLCYMRVQATCTRISQPARQLCVAAASSVVGPRRLGGWSAQSPRQSLQSPQTGWGAGWALKRPKRLRAPKQPVGQQCLELTPRRGRARRARPCSAAPAHGTHPSWPASRRWPSPRRS